MKYLALVTLLILTSGCEFVPQTADLAIAEDTVAKSDIGNGISVSVRVTDERANTEIGHRGIWDSGNITAKQNIAVVFHQGITEALSNLGFNVTEAEPEVQLNVEVRAFNFDTELGFWTSGEKVFGAIKVRAKATGKGDYENFYRYEDEDRVIFYSFADHNEKRLNIMANAMVEKIFSDPGLVNYLTN